MRILTHTHRVCSKKELAVIHATTLACIPLQDSSYDVYTLQRTTGYTIITYQCKLREETTARGHNTLHTLMAWEGVCVQDNKYTCTHTHAHTHMHTHTCTHTHAHTHMHTHMHSNAHTHEYKHAHTHAYKHAHTHTCTYPHMHTPHTCTYPHMHTPHTCTYPHMHTPHTCTHKNTHKPHAHAPPLDHITSQSTYISTHAQQAHTSTCTFMQPQEHTHIHVHVHGTQTAYLQCAHINTPM